MIKVILVCLIFTTIFLAVLTFELDQLVAAARTDKTTVFRTTVLYLETGAVVTSRTAVSNIDFLAGRGANVTEWLNPSTGHFDERELDKTVQNYLTRQYSGEFSITIPKGPFPVKKMN